MFLENITWLVLCIYFEARGENHETKVKVAQVVMNRTIQRSQSIKEVVTAPKQFEWYNGGSIPEIKEPEVLWRCVQAALSCVKRRSMGDTFGGANHFFDDSIKPPSWAKTMKYLGKSGSIHFFKL
jgi:spore germination cell wall hydrolase CwlJ-like protein